MLGAVNYDIFWLGTCHTATRIINLLKGQFGDNVISRNGPVNWPPKSCDLTPPDYFLWGYGKSMVYDDKPTTLEALKVDINQAINRIRPEILEKVVKNWTDQTCFVKIIRGRHIPVIIVKTKMALNLLSQHFFFIFIKFVVFYSNWKFSST